MKIGDIVIFKNRNLFNADINVKGKILEIDMLSLYPYTVGYRNDFGVMRTHMFERNELEPVNCSIGRVYSIDGMEHSPTDGDKYFASERN